MHTLTVCSVIRYTDRNGHKVVIEGPQRPLPREQWAERIAEMKRAHRKREPDVANATDAGELPSTWVGDHVEFLYLMGQNAIWSGPAALHTPDGRCAFCGDRLDIPSNSVCLSPECLRTSRAIEERIAPVLARPQTETYDRPQPLAPLRAKVQAVHEGLRGGTGN